MASESPKKGFAAKLLSRLGGQASLSDERVRREAIAAAVAQYLREYSGATDSSQARTSLDELAVRFREEGLEPLDIYREAYTQNRGDVQLLKFLVGEYETNAPMSREASEAYWALTVAEPSDLRHFERLIEYYRTGEDPLAMVRLEEQIVDRYHKVKSGELPPGPHAAANEAMYQPALEDLARTYSEMGRLDPTATVIYERWFENFPNDNEALETLTRAYIAAKRRDRKALAVFEQHFVMAPQDEPLQRALIESYIETGNPERGVVLMENMLQGASDDFGLLSQIVGYYRSRNIINDTSMKYFRRFLQARPDDHEVLRIVADYHAVREATSSEAAGYYSRSLGEPSQDWVYRLLLARHHMDEERHEEALEVLEPLRGTPLMRGRVLMAYATALAGVDRLDSGAAWFYEQAIAEGSRSKAIHGTLCHAYVKLKRLDNAALGIFEETLQIDPANAWANFGMAAYFFRLDEPRNAFRYMLKHLKRHREDAAGQKLAGVALARCLSDDALMLLESLPTEVSTKVLLAALAESPHDARLLLPLARVFLREDRQDEEAWRVFRNTAWLYPDDVVARDRLARVCEVVGRTEEAGEHLRRLARMAGYGELKSQFETHQARLRAIVVDGLGRLTQAILAERTVSRENEEFLRLALRTGTSDPALYRRLALLAAERNEVGAEVLPIYEKTLEHFPELQTLKHLMMRCYVAVGDTGPVFQHAHELLEQSPRNKIVLSLLVDCLSSTDCYDEEVHDLVCMQAREVPDDEKTLTAYALLNYRANRFDAEAAEIYAKAADFAPEDLRILLLTALARCCEELNRPDQALAAYGRILEIIPDDLDIAKRLAFNYVLHGETSARSVELICQAFAEGPYDTELYLFLADVFINRRESRLAQYLVDRIQSEDPKSTERVLGLLEKSVRLGMGGPQLAIQLAEHYYLTGQRDRCLSTIDEIASLTPDQAQKVIELYNIILVSDGDDMEVRRRRGELLCTTGDLLSAVEDLTVYWEVEGRKRPISDEFVQLLGRYCTESTVIKPRLMILIARSFYRAGRYDQAVALCGRLIARDRYNADGLLLFARCLMQRGDFQLALRTLCRLDRTTEVKDCLYRLACEFTASRDHDDAEIALHAITDLEPEYRDCMRRLREIARSRREGLLQRDKRLEETRTGLSMRARERFIPVEELARTPVTRVVKAYDCELDEVAALKIPSLRFGARNGLAESYKSMARTVRRLTHPHILRIRDIAEGDGLDFISLEYMGGGDLGQRLKARTLGTRDKLSVALQVAEALEYAHRHDILHRSLRPTNVLFNDLDVVKVADFGLDAIFEEPSVLSTHVRLAPPTYTAPEVLTGGAHTTFSDMYSYGVLLYELFRGEPPFVGGDLVQKHLGMPPAPLDEVQPMIADVIMRCLEKRPEYRYSSMREVLRDLQMAIL